MAVQNNLVIVEYQAKIDSLEKGLQKIEAGQKQVSASTKKSMSDIEAGAKKATASTQTLTKNTSELKNKLSELSSNLPFVNQIKQIESLGSALISTGSAATTSANGFKILRTAIIGSGIGALVIALIALISYFKRTDEGGARLAGIMSALGAATDLVTGLFVTLGEAVFNGITSFEGFKEMLSNIGDFIAGQFINRFNAAIKGFTAFKDLIVDFAKNGTDADFEGAIKKITDAQLDFATGVENTSDKIGKWSAEVAAAAAAAYDWEQRMDALGDKMREDSKTIAANDAMITKLVIASKNKNIADEESLRLLNEASSLEENNLNIVLKNEQAKLALIKEKNDRERLSINQNKQALTEEFNNDKTSLARKKAISKELLSINDNLSQEEVDQINKITALKQSSDNLQEKINNRRDTKLEEIFQNGLKRAAQEEELQENLAKEKFLIGTSTAEQLEEELYNIKLNGLLNQKALLLADSRDVVDIDKAILDLELQNRLKHDKDLADADAKRKAKKAADDKAANDAFLAMVKKRLDDEDKLAAEHEAKLKAIKSFGFQAINDLAQGFESIAASKKQLELSKELSDSQKKTDQEAKFLQDKLDKGIISQQQYDRQKAALDQKQRKKESDIKLKQFKADKKAALIHVAIDTALGIAKAFAQLGPIGGALGAALVAGEGLIQAALIQGQPTPAFAKGKINIQGPGTSISDSINARLSKGESVMTAEETQQHMGSLQAMRKRNYNNYIHTNFVVPALEKMQRESISRRDAKMSQAVINSSIDLSNTERLLKKNGTVKLSNVKELAKELAKQNIFNNPFYK